MKKLFAIVALLACWQLATGSRQLFAQTQIGSTGQLQQNPGTPWQIGGAWNLTASSPATLPFNVRGASYYRVLFVPSAGFAGTCGFSVDSASAVDVNGVPISPVTGGVLPAATIGSCAAAGSYITTSAVTPTNFALITPTITGAGTITVVLFGYTDSSAASGGSSVTVTSLPALPAGNNIIGKVLNAQPAATSGTITGTTCPGIGCVSLTSGGYGVVSFSFHGTYSGVTIIFEISDDGGTTWYANTCSASNAPTQAVSVVLGTNATSSWDCGGYGTTNVRARATAYGSGTVTVNGTLSSVAVDPGAAYAAIATDNAGNGITSSNNGLSTTPAGFTAGFAPFQTAVTASAVQLASNATHNFCVRALPGNTLTIYIGGSGVTTATGFPLLAGDSICPQFSNTNLIYVIASGTGSSVAVFGY